MNLSNVISTDEMGTDLGEVIKKEDECGRVRTEKEQNKIDRLARQINDINSGDNFIAEKAKQEILDDYGGFITSLVKEKYTSFINNNPEILKEFFHEGVCGIFEALKKYNPNAENCALPTTFFRIYILGNCQKLACEKSGITQHYAIHVTKVNQAIERLKKAGIEEPSISQIAEESGLKQHSVRVALERKENAYHISCENDDFMDSLTNPECDEPEHIYEKTERLEILAKALNKLNTTERNILVLRYGLLNDGVECNYKTISEKLNITVDNVKRQEQSAIKKLQNDYTVKARFNDNNENIRSHINKNSFNTVSSKEADKLMEHYCSFKDEEYVEIKLI